MGKIARSSEKKESNLVADFVVGLVGIAERMLGSEIIKAW